MKWYWNEDELEMQWSLSVEELALLPGHTDSERLGFAILLKFFQFQGFFPDNQKSILHEIGAYLAQATNSAVADLDVYEWNGRTGQRHRKKTLSFLGLRRPMRLRWNGWLARLFMLLKPRYSNPSPTC